MNRILIYVLLLLGILPVSLRAETPSRLEQLFQLIDQYKLNTLEKVISVLPEDMLSNFTLQYDGNGLQEASRQFPRAILFGLDGRFVLTFNGHPDQEKYNSIEVMQYNNKEAKFELYEIEFPLIRDIYGKAIRPALNPKTCTACHGTDPHPFWNSYATWPGLYGSDDDYLEEADFYNNELKDFKTFMKYRETHPRYRWLKPMSGSENSPYRPPDSEPNYGSYQFRPNLRVGSLLGALNTKRAFRLLRQSPYFQKFGFLLAVSLNCHPQTLELLNPKDLEQTNQTIIQVLNQKGYLLPRPDLPAINPVNMIKIFDLNVSDWNIEKVPKSSIFPTSFSGDGNQMHTDQMTFHDLWPLVASQAEELQTLFASWYVEMPTSKSAYPGYHVASQFDATYSELLDQINTSASLIKPPPTDSMTYLGYGCDEIFGKAMSPFLNNVIQ